MRRFGLLLVIILLAGCRPRVWTEEPTAFMGVKLGQPLSSSMPLCTDAIRKPCADSYGEIAHLENASSDYGLVTILQYKSIVAGIDLIFAGDNYMMALSDLTKRYGPPTSEIGSTNSWDGQRIAIRIVKPDRGQPGLITVTLKGALPPPPQHSNPF